MIERDKTTGMLTVDPSLHTRLVELSGQAPEHVEPAASDRLRVMIGSVTVVSPLTVKPDSEVASGGSTVIAGLKRLGAYSPVVTDRVLCLWYEGWKQWLVIDKIV